MNATIEVKEVNSCRILLVVDKVAYLQYDEELVGSCVGCYFVEREDLCRPEKYFGCVGKIFKFVYNES